MDIDVWSVSLWFCERSLEHGVAVFRNDWTPGACA